MSYETYLAVLYAQLLAFMLISFALASYYLRNSKKNKQVLETVKEEVLEPRPIQKIKADEPPVSELSYLDIIYEQSHKEDSKIKDVRLHGKHKN